MGDVKWLRDGQDFHFAADSGFTGSSQGRHDPRASGPLQTDEYGDGSLLSRRKGGRARKHYDAGGQVQPRPMPPHQQQEPTISMPVSTAMNTIKGLINTGRQQGAHATMQGVAQAIRMHGQQQSPQAPQQGGALAGMAHGGHLTASQRHHMPEGEFALPGERYPINDANHARNALARVSQHGSPSEQAKVKAAVHRKYPDIGKK